MMTGTRWNHGVGFVRGTMISKRQKTVLRACWVVFWKSLKEPSIPVILLACYAHLSDHRLTIENYPPIHNRYNQRISRDSSIKDTVRNLQSLRPFL